MDNALYYLQLVAEAAGFPEPKSIPEIVAAIIGTVLSFVGVIFFCLILYGGFIWMISGGNEEKVYKAKNVIKDAVIGLFVILAAYSLTRFVVNAIVSATV